VGGPADLLDRSRAITARDRAMQRHGSGPADRAFGRDCAVWMKRSEIKTSAPGQELSVPADHWSALVTTSLERFTAILILRLAVEVADARRKTVCEIEQTS